MLPIFLSIQDKKDDYLSSFKGSSFSLTDINNNPITEKSFEGPLTAIFFGFTHCPDVCPMTLNKLDIIVDRLEKENKNLKVIFISIDPDRDTPKVMRDYINSFNSNFIGITGKTEKIFLLSRSWGIISEKIFSENGEYSVNHSSPVILLKNGKFVARLTHRDDIKQSLKIIKKYL
jgi:protein SCO1/2